MKTQNENNATLNMSQKLLEIGVKRQAVQNQANEQAEILQTKIYAQHDIQNEYLEALKQEFLKHIGPSLIDGMLVQCNFEFFSIHTSEHSRDLFTIHCPLSHTSFGPDDKESRRLPEINYYTGGSTNEKSELERLIVIGDVAKFILHYGKYLSDGLEKVDREFSKYKKAEDERYEAQKELDKINTEITLLNRAWAVEFAICNGGIRVEESKISIRALVPGNKRVRSVYGVDIVSETEKRITMIVHYADSTYVEDKTMDRKAAEEIIYDIWKTHNVKEA